MSNPNEPFAIGKPVEFPTAPTPPANGGDYQAIVAAANYAAVAEELLAEAQRARLKFPAFNSAHEGYAVIAEELDELWDDVKADRVEASIAEAVQVGAMAIRYIADMRAKQ